MRCKTFVLLKLKECLVLKTRSYRNFRLGCKIILIFGYSHLILRNNFLRKKCIFKVLKEQSIGVMQYI